MRALKRLLLGVILLTVVMAAVAYALPRHVIVQRSVAVNAPESDIFPYLNDLRRFNEWSPWAARDPETRFEYSGQPQGVGARMQWRSDHPELGEGEQEIVESEPGKRVRVALDFADRGAASAHYELRPAGAGTSVTWRLSADVGNNPVSRWMGLLFDRSVGKDFEQGLARLKELVETDAAR